MDPTCGPSWARLASLLRSTPRFCVMVHAAKFYAGFGQNEARNPYPTHEGVKIAQVQSWIKVLTVKEKSGCRRSTTKAATVTLTAELRFREGIFLQNQVQTSTKQKNRGPHLLLRGRKSASAEALRIALTAEPLYKMANNDHIGNVLPGEKVDDNAEDELAKAQPQQIQGPKQVNTMESVNLLVNKRRQHGKQILQGNNQNWGNQGQEKWNNNNNNSNKWGNNNQNWGNNSNWGGNNNQRSWNNGNQGNRGPGFQRPPMFQQPNNPPPFPSQGPSLSNNEMGQIESMFERMMKKNVDSDPQLESHNTSILNQEVQLGQISQALNTRPKGNYLVTR
uniref:Uncharacterized protein n=1 Tax=Nicotiana tabacum TaxID=4097 RepID=A0A1S3WYZ1_TOBAC|nr:PREDICTED: putative uncharacterized protein DDB_G0286901 [Nicotiana tabacum]